MIDTSEAQPAPADMGEHAFHLCIALPPTHPHLYGFRCIECDEAFAVTNADVATKPTGEPYTLVKQVEGVCPGCDGTVLHWSLVKPQRCEECHDDRVA